MHIEPFFPKELRVLVPVNGDSKDARLSDHFGRASFFALARLSGERVVELDFIENVAREKQARAGLTAVKHIDSQTRR